MNWLLKLRGALLPPQTTVLDWWRSKLHKSQIDMQLARIQFDRPRLQSAWTELANKQQLKRKPYHIVLCHGRQHQGLTHHCTRMSISWARTAARARSRSHPQFKRNPNKRLVCETFSRPAHHANVKEIALKFPRVRPSLHICNRRGRNFRSRAPRWFKRNHTIHKPVSDLSCCSQQETLIKGGDWGHKAHQTQRCGSRSRGLGLKRAKVRNAALSRRCLPHDWKLSAQIWLPQLKP